MFRFASVGALAGSAAVVGLIWAGRMIRGRGRKAEVPTGFPTDERLVDEGWEGDALDDAARSEAEREPGTLSPEDLEFDLRDEAEDGIDALDLATKYALEQVDVADEPYDALDAEDVGTEWLLRATQTSAPERVDPIELLGSSPIIEVHELGDGGPNEAGFGSDQEGAPLADHAGTHDEDVAAELPVGNVDAQGNTELHAPANPPDALRAPPTGELAVSERELAARNEPPQPSRR